ncbi:MAG: hypothetical protein CMH38_06830 [Microbacterium sp.]|jgi:hypothetical protein|uniref:hypothetical protein n=1 Tax=unclassified Microbacterium TaxID=2609290 RepID=UPI0008D945AB|nr:MULTISPECIES: hypothetical protein [unclassified Microbacterium]MAY49626.1 hypothetical protein [Microbacterium sp.]HAS31308.1 hypothetical protein [Microbacterium sp.]HBR88998.1 hypothetical protein [Microbacterium sp.]HBS74251.1 hypothetical protein [Microbacterium sp.]|tara:strand:+ start:8187 stop:8411 length:225 start_codon:yes stop_codon:yes gene_type:complete
MSEPRTGFPRGRLQWLLGTVLLFVVGVLIGLILQNVWLGVILAGAISIGWLIAYESWRGRRVGLDDPDDDGAQV